MNKNKIPEVLAEDIAGRATTNVRVGAVIVDVEDSIISWGWSSCGPKGDGQCAEQHAIRRANPRRLAGATIYIWGAWKHSGNLVTSLPCMECMALIIKKGIRTIVHITKDGTWKKVFP